MKRNGNIYLALALTLASAAPPRPFAQNTTPPRAEIETVGVLRPAELERLIPPSVFFQGQSATVQLRNSGGVRFPGGALMLAVKVDTGGYSTSVQERYQDYLITETPLKIGEGPGARTLPPGAYGIGFVAGNLLVMDIGGHTLFTLASPVDAGLRRPSPLQVLAHDSTFRIYSGRAYIAFAAAPNS